MPRLGHNRAGRQILAGLAAIGAAPQAGRDRDEVAAVLAMRLAVLLHGDRVGARRHERAGEDAHGRAGDMRQMEADGPP